MEQHLVIRILPVGKNYSTDFNILRGSLESKSPLDEISIILINPGNGRTNIIGSVRGLPGKRGLVIYFQLISRLFSSFLSSSSFFSLHRGQVIVNKRKAKGSTGFFIVRSSIKEAREAGPPTRRVNLFVS